MEISKRENTVVRYKEVAVIERIPIFETRYTLDVSEEELAWLTAVLGALDGGKIESILGRNFSPSVNKFKKYTQADAKDITDNLFNMCADVLEL